MLHCHKLSAVFLQKAPPRLLVCRLHCQVAQTHNESLEARERSHRHFLANGLPAESRSGAARRDGREERFHRVINARRTNARHNAAKRAALSGTRAVAEEVMRTFPLISGGTN